MDMSRGSKFKDGIRIAAGAYLIYLGIRVFREGILTGSMTGRSYVIGILAVIAFLGFGAGVIVYSVISLARANKQEREENPEGSADGSEGADGQDGSAKEKEEAVLLDGRQAIPERIENSVKEESAKSGGENRTNRSSGAGIFDKAYGNIRGHEEEEERPS